MKYYDHKTVKETLENMHPDHRKIFGVPNALEMDGKPYPAGMDAAKPLDLLPQSNERDIKGLAQKGA